MKGMPYLLILSLLIAAAAASLSVGEVSLNAAISGALQRATGETTSWNPIIDERLPRLIVTLATGASLATSGLVMQALFQNPLASPSVLGVSCGGSLAVTAVYVLGIQFSYPFAIPLAAIFGCAATLFLVYGLSEERGILQVNTLILTGIAISTLLIACQGVIVYALRDNWHLMQTLTEWEAGSTIDRSWRHVHMQLPLTAVGLYGCWRYRKELDIAALGSEEALNLGVDIERVRFHLFLSVVLLVGGALAAVGIIAFFGLVLPHLMRRIFGPLNERLVPLCIAGGALLFTLLDLAIRIGNIRTLSIGNISAIIGGLFFLTLLFHAKRTPLRA